MTEIERRSSQCAICGAENIPDVGVRRASWVVISISLCELNDIDTAILAGEPVHVMAERYAVVCAPCFSKSPDLPLILYGDAGISGDELEAVTKQEAAGHE